MAVAPTKVDIIYGGDIKIEFFEGKHLYKVYDLKNPEKEPHIPVSATGATGVKDKPALKFWAANLTRDFLLGHLKNNVQITEQLIVEAAKQHMMRSQEAKDSGTNVHKWIEQHIAGLKPAMPADKQEQNAVLAFLRWQNQHKVEFIGSEKLVYSKQHDFVGLLDIVGVVDGQRCVIDLKTGTPQTVQLYSDGKKAELVAAYEEHRYQTAAYHKAWEEMTGDKLADLRWVLYLGKETPTFEAVQVNNVDGDYSAFLGLLSCKNRDKEIAEEYKALQL